MLRAPDVECRDRLVANLFRGPSSAHWHQQTKVFVELNQRRRTRFVGVHADFDRFRPVVLALEELATAAIADARDLWRTFRCVKHRLALCASLASAQACDDLHDDRGERETFVLHQLFQGMGLIQRARKSVEDKAPPQCKQPPRSRTRSHTVESGTRSPRRIYRGLRAWLG
jgi:hypothetical protein